MVTISDIAKASGVTHATVSRILNNRNKEVWPGASARAERIRQLARQMGYRPNAAARSIQSGRTDCLAFVVGVGPPLGMVPPGILNSLERQFSERGYHFSVVRCPAGDINPDKWPRIFRERLIDGAVLDGWSPIPETFITQIQAQRLPVVTIRSKRDRDAVYIDEFNAGRLAAQHLLDLGHRRIDFIDYGWEGHYEDIDRREGYCSAMRDAGLVPALHVIPDSVQDAGPVESSYQQLEVAERILTPLADRPTAVIAGVAPVARAVQGAALRSGMKLPRDLSLITFSDYIVTGAFPITTLMSEMGNLADTAAAMLFTKLGEPATNIPAVIHQSKIEDGRSTAPPSPSKRQQSGG